MTNVIYKQVRPGPSEAWQRKAEEHAYNSVPFVVRPFLKERHWAFLEDLCDRFQLRPRFDALQRAVYFDRPVGDKFS